MLVYYFVPFIVSNRYLLFWTSNGHNSVTVQNRTHVYMNFFDGKDLGNHLLQLCPKVVKHPVYPSQHFPLGAAFICQAGNFWTLLRTSWMGMAISVSNGDIWIISSFVSYFQIFLVTVVCEHFKVPPYFPKDCRLLGRDAMQSGT